MADFQAYSTGHIVSGIDDWNHLLDHGLEKPAAYIVRNTDGTAEAINGRTGKKDYTEASLSSLLSTLYGALTAGRTWKEKIVVKGSYVLSAPMALTDYLILDLSEAKLALANGVNNSIVRAENVSKWEIVGGLLDGNKGEQSAGHGIEIDSCDEAIVRATRIQNVKGSGVTAKNLTNSLLQRLVIKNAEMGAGINFNEGCNHSDMDHCLADTTGSAGFSVSGFNGAVRDVNVVSCHSIKGNYCGIFIYFNAQLVNVISCEVEQVTFGWGIEFENVYNCAAIGNMIHDCPPSIGIKTGFESGYNNAIIGNTVRNVGRHGIVVCGCRTTVIGNTVERASQAQDGQYDGIAVGGADGGGGEGSGSLSHNAILGNIIFIPAGYNRPRHGIREYGSYDYDTLKDNIIHGSPTNEVILWVGPHTIVRDNQGARTENHGEATIANGQTSVSFDHGVYGVTSDGSNLAVVLGPKHSEVADAVWSANAAQITITVPSAVTADRKTSWEARRI